MSPALILAAIAAAAAASVLPLLGLAVWWARSRAPRPAAPRGWVP